MKSYSLIGLEPTLITHEGTINGKKPRIETSGTPEEEALDPTPFAEPAVTAGRATFKDLVEGGLFAFDKKAIVIESLLGTATIVTAESDGEDTSRATPTTFPFDLLPGEWLKFSSGSEVGCICRLKGERIF